VTNRASILIVDDEPGVCQAVQLVLERQGFQVVTALRAAEALRFLEEQPVDLALLDLKMEGMGGLELMAEIKRRWPDTVIMILTGSGTLQSALGALRQGAHDYLLKPSSPQDIIASVEKGLEKRRLRRRREQLLARIETDLAELRSERPLPPDSPTVGSEELAEDALRVLQVGSLVMDLQKYAASFEGESLTLTPLEFKILASLARRKGEVVKSSTLVREAQGYECDESEARAIVKTHISHLRKKMRTVSRNAAPIVNVRGVGYMLAVEETE
jgi:DNA-binding response OmpR family regulator